MHALPSPAYGWLLLAGVFLSLVFWARAAKRDERLMWIWVAALVGAFMGAKVVYLLAEGWLHWGDEDRWVQYAFGKSILGGLAGGYAGVEIAKHLLGYRQATGDRFAVFVAMGLVLGRLGCALQGCCLGSPCKAAWYSVKDSAGVERWPAAQAELLFNGVALIALGWLRYRRLLPGQHFHLYLIGYGVFRFAHEYLRDTPRILGGFSGYQLAAMGVTMLGAIGFALRARSRSFQTTRGISHEGC